MTPPRTAAFPESHSATGSVTSATSPATTGPHSGKHPRRHSPHSFDEPQPSLILLAVSDHFPATVDTEDSTGARAQRDRGCGSRWCCSAPPWRSLPRQDGSSGSAHECSARSIDTAGHRPIGSRVSRTSQRDCGHWSVAAVGPRSFCDWPIAFARATLAAKEAVCGVTCPGGPANRKLGPSSITGWDIENA